jgi:hypothetical protein
VFDSTRHAIEGFVTHTILRVQYETQTDDAGCIELVLSPAQIKELLEKAEKALRKIELLRESIQKWIPDGLADSAD